jgi:hypothetical protein
MSRSLTGPVLQKYAYNNYFLETGTHTGGGVQVAQYVGFQHIISIDIDEVFYKASKKLFAESESDIRLYLGDSAIILPEIINKIKEPITFWLDGHVSTRMVVGVIEVPLLIELDIIAEHPIKTHTILIDDRRMMGKIEKTDKPWSHVWENVTEEKVIKKLLEINPNYKIIYEDSVNAKNDIIVAVL